MKKVMLTIAAAMCFAGVSYCQQDTTTMNRNKVPNAQGDRNSNDTNTNNHNKSSKKKSKRTKTDSSMNRNMDSTSRRNSR